MTRVNLEPSPLPPGDLAGVVTKAAVIATGLAPADIGADAAGAAATAQSAAEAASVLRDGTGMPASQVNISSFLGASKVVRPGGGSADSAAINAALADSSTTSVYLNGNYVADATIRIPSDKELILADAKITAKNGLLDPIIANSQFDVGVGNTGDSNIHIRSIGRAILNGNGANNPEQVPGLYRSTCLLLVNVDQFTVDGIQAHGSAYVPYMFQACKNGSVRKLHVDRDTDLGYVHVSQGSSNVTVDGMTSRGTFADSVISIVAMTTAAYSSPYTLTLSDRSVSGVTFRNVTVDSSSGMVNVINDSTGSVSGVTFDNFHNLNAGTFTGSGEFWFGIAGYSGITNPANGSISDVTISNYSTRSSCNFLLLQTPVTNLAISGVRYGTARSCQNFIYDGTWTMPAGLNPQLTGLKITNCDIPTIASAKAFMAMGAGWNITDVKISDVRIGTLFGAFLKNTSDVAILDIGDVRIGTLNAVPFQSTGRENGTVRGFTYRAKGTLFTGLFASTPSFKIEQPFSQLAAADLTPATIQGSRILCYQGKDPTGGAAPGGEYIADGTAWNLVASFNSKFRPNQIYAPLLFHYEGASIKGVADGASVARWPDSNGVAALLQGTGANQPKYVLADATLNSLPAVKFDGTASFMQTTSLAPVAQANPTTFFVVYYWSNPITGSEIVNTGSAGQSTTDGIRAYKNGSNLAIYSGSANVGTLALASTTAYLLAFAVSGGSGFIGQNKAAWASLTSGSSGSARSLNGLTVGAVAAGTSGYAGIVVAEMIAYTGLLSSDYPTIAAGLAAKYAITLG